MRVRVVMPYLVMVITFTFRKFSKKFKIIEKTLTTVGFEPLTFYVRAWQKNSKKPKKCRIWRSTCF